MTPAIHRLAADDWRAARAIRLRALADAPGAFASTLAREEAFDEARWRQRVGENAWFVAGDPAAGPPAGVVAGVPEPGDADGRHLVGMWVEPAARGRGVADLLVDAVVTWSRTDGGRRLALWVVDGNARARRCYERLGFTPTGERQPLPTDPSVTESRMLRDLA